MGRNKMSERPTPETDAFIASQNHSPTTHQLRNFARIFEQERDEARENLDEEKKFHHRTHAELVQAQCKLLDMQMGRDEIQGKYDNEAVEHMLAINKICNERDILRLDAQKEAERINYLERKLNKEINEANQDHLGWENKWKIAVDMAAIAENKISNLEDQLDLAMKVIKRLEANQP
jgi:hypothetical protein